jgi:two-component system catabolic regulation response regulator CreB
MNSTVLLIEDEVSIADNISYALQTEGFRVSWVQLGGDGIKHLQANPVDLIILDVGLPDINGFEVCKSIRKFSEVPIIFLTARSEEIDRIVGLEIGADDYVSKPFSPRELSARVKVILKRVNPSKINYPNTAFEIYDNKNSICYQGVELALTRYEYLILKTLLQRPQQVFSRNQLMDIVWDEPEASYDRAVDTHIKSLRAKLKKINTQDPIQTHRGFGYSINPNLE